MDVILAVDQRTTPLGDIMQQSSPFKDILLLCIHFRNVNRVPSCSEDHVDRVKHDFTSFVPGDGLPSLARQLLAELFHRFLRLLLFNFVKLLKGSLGPTLFALFETHNSFKVIDEISQDRKHLVEIIVDGPFHFAIKN